MNRRILPTVLLAVAMTMAFLVPTGGAAQADDDGRMAGDQVTGDRVLNNLGPALEATNVGTGAAGPDMDGGALLYATSAGHPPTFTVIDEETGEVVFQTYVEGEENLPEKIVPTEAGLTYVTFRSGSATQFYVYDVEANTFEPGVRTCRTCEIDKTVFRVFDVADDGTLFMGSYPDASVFSWDPATDEVRDYGPVFTEGQYIWGLTLAGDQLFVGTGNGPGLGQFFQVDTISGDITRVEYPDDAFTPTVIGELQAVGDIILVPLFGDDHHVRMYDAANEEWVCEDTPAPGFPQPTDAFAEGPIDGKTYFKTGADIYEVEPAACTYRSLDFAETGLDATELSGVKIVPTGPADEPAVDSLVSFRTDGSYVLFDPLEGSVRDMPSSVLPSPVTTQSIGLGPDGGVYIGGFLSPDIIARMDPGTDEIDILDGPEQADTIVTIGDRLVVSDYPNAVVSSGDLSQPWQWGENPRELFTGAEHDQDRIFEMIDADGLGVLGSIPGYGLLGGGLAVFDPGTGEHDTYLDLVPDQQPGALAHQEDVVYVGTTIQGGAGADPTADEAVLFEFDLQSRDLTEQTVPVPGAGTIGALEFGDEALWGMSDTGVLFQYDPESHEVVDSVSVPEFGAATNWGRLPILTYSETDNLYYGIAATRAFFTFDPATQQVAVIDDEQEWKGLTVMPDGRIYVIDDRDIYRYGDADAVCTETITGAHAGPLTVTDGVTCLDEATVRGTITVAVGAGISIVDSETRGRLTAEGAETVEITDSEVRGRLTVRGSTSTVALTGNDIHGIVEIADNNTTAPPVVAANTVRGSLLCTGNDPAPANDGQANTVSGRTHGQCAGL